MIKSKGKVGSRIKPGPAPSVMVDGRIDKMAVAMRFYTDNRKGCNYMKTKILNVWKRAGFAGAICVAASLVCADLRAQTAAVTVPPGVQDVVKLSKAGIGEDVILSQVRNNGATYSLNVDQIIYLKEQGVSQNVIKALMGTGAPAVSPNPAPAPVQPAIPNAPVAPGAPTIPGPGAPGAPPPPGAPPAPTFENFQAELSSSGTWIQDPTYGMVWRPSVAVTDPFWRPYADAGHWVYTDAGWAWQSDYPWGDLVFHYGRWQRGPVGWMWIPGYDWAPAWVCWRHSEGYCGWAPLPPAAVFRAGVGLTFEGRLAVDIDFGLGPAAFTFVAYDHFWDRSLRGFILPRERVDLIYRRSVVMNGYRLDHGRFFVEGFGHERVAEWTHHEVRAEEGFRDRGFRRVEPDRGFRGPDRRDDRRDPKDR